MLTSFLINLFLFVIICPAFLFFLGRIFLPIFRISLDLLSSLYVSIICGITCLILESVLFGLIGFRWLGTLLLFMLIIFSITKHIKEYLASIRIIIYDIKLVFLLVIGVFIQGFINFPSGWKYASGLNFWGAQGNDGLWHISLMEEVSRHFPPHNPLYANHFLQNYHYTSDIFMGEFYRIFHFFGTLDLYFRFYPILFSFLLGLGTFVFVSKMAGPKSAYLAVFFTYLCGSFGYIYSFLSGGSLFSGETTFWSSQLNTVLSSPPHALGLIYFIAIIFLITLWEKVNQQRILFLVAFLGFSLVTVKVPYGVILSVSLIGTGVYTTIFLKRWQPLILGLVLLLGNYLSLKLISPLASQFVTFQPLWFPINMMSERLGQTDWILRRQYYFWENTFKSWLHIIVQDLQAIFIFIVGNLGMRTLGLIPVALIFLKRKNITLIFISLCIISSISVNLLFLQSGSAFNTIQFLQISLYLTGVLSGVVLSKLLLKIRYQPLFTTLILLIVLALSIPTVVGNLIEYTPQGRSPLALISNSELEALHWIRNNTPPESIILSTTFNNLHTYDYPDNPRPISAWYSTSYIHAMSGRNTYLSGEDQLKITGYNIDNDLISVKKYFRYPACTVKRVFAVENTINYIYLRRDEMKISLSEFRQGLRAVYENNEVIIYKYN